MISKCKVCKNIAFEKECSKIKLANLTLSKQQFADKLAKKLFPWIKRFLDFAKGYPMLGCRRLAEIFKIGKNVAVNIIEEEKNICSQHELFHGN